MAQASRSHSTESPAYRDLLKQYNEEGASTAKNENSSFIASMPMEQTSVMLPVTKAKPAPQAEPTARRSRTRQDENSKDSEKKEDPRLKALLARINPEKSRRAAVRTGLRPCFRGTNALNSSGDTTTGSAGGYDS